MNLKLRLRHCYISVAQISRRFSLINGLGFFLLLPSTLKLFIITTSKKTDRCVLEQIRHETLVKNV